MYDLKISLLLSRSIFRRAIGSWNLVFSLINYWESLASVAFLRGGGMLRWGVGAMGGKLAGIKGFCTWACARLGWGRVLRENRASE